MYRRTRPATSPGPERWRLRRGVGGVGLAAAVTSAAVLLAGCGASAPAPATESQGGTAEITQAPDTLTVAWNGKMNNLDPLLAYNTQETGALHLIAGTLTEVHKGEGTKPFPGLASSYDTSSDGLTWTFHLRDGLKFSDGSALTSADVKATLERAKTDKASVWTVFSDPIKTVSAPDASTVVLTLNRAYPSLTTVLAEAEFLIAPKNSVDKGPSYWSAQPSAGPYMLQPWDGGNSSTFVVNPNYWGPKPLINKIVFQTVSDPNAALSQLRTKQVDMVEGLPISSQPTLAGTPGLQYQLIQNYGFFGLAMNNNAKPLDDVNVRRAVSLAIDRDQINQTVFYGLAKPVSSFWPSTMTGYDPSIPTAQDLTQAKSLLAGTACASGCSLEIAYQPGVAWSASTAQLISSQLSKIGITVKTTALSDVQWNDDVILHSNVQAAVTNIYDTVNIPDGQLEYAVRPDSFYHAFYSNWKNPDLTKIIETARTASGDAQPAALKAVNDVFEQDMPYATLVTNNDLWAQRVGTDIVGPESPDWIEVARAGQ